MARPVLRRASSAIAVAAIAVALIRSVAAAWFSSEIIATPPTEEVAAPPLTERVVLVVIDGLRHDTALRGDLMPQLQAIGRAGASGLAMASLVTMTGLGVRTLGTGTSPALADILLEAHLPPVGFDNVFAALRRRGGHIAWFGNTAWKELFGANIDLDPRIDRTLDMLSRANNIWPADKVIVRRAVAMMARRDWQLCIVHLGGLDNASHRFTPFGDEFRAKARAVDDDLARIVGAAGAATTVIITSDHGTSDRGHHGSGEPITRRTPLVLTGAGIARGRTLDAQQTDVAPTIAALLGLPVPAPSEGQILLDALDVAPATAAALRAANVRQLQRYAAAYAAARDLAPPVIDATAPGMRRLGDWIETARASSSLVAALWAAALVLAALALFGAPPSIATSAAAIAIAVGSAASGGRGEAPAVLAVVASAAGAVGALRQLPRRWSSLGAGLAAIAALEAAMVAWKLNHRLVEMKLHDVYDALHLGDQAFQLAAIAVTAVIATLAARRWWPTTRWAAIGVVVAASALADSIAIPAAIVLGIAAAMSVSHRRARSPLARAAGAGREPDAAAGSEADRPMHSPLARAAGAGREPDAAAGPRVVTTGRAIPSGLLVGLCAAAAVASLAVAESAALALFPVDVAAPLVLAALGAWLGPARRRERLALLGFGGAAAAVRLAGNPATPYRATLLAIAITAVVLARLRRGDRPLASTALAHPPQGDRPLALLGWAGAIALAMLSRSAQLPGLVAWTGFAALVGQSAELEDSGERAVLAATFAAIGFRFACFALFEGAFELSHLEVWLAYEGNPGTAVAFGAAIIAIKFALPLAIGLALITARATAAARRAAIAWTTAFLCLRIAHIVIGMTVARGTFYSPYLDSGQLAFTCLMLASAPLVIALFAAVGVWHDPGPLSDPSRALTPTRHDRGLATKGS
jgi:hypothetical protein